MVKRELDKLVLWKDSFELVVGALHAWRPWLFRNRGGESIVVIKQE